MPLSTRAQVGSRPRCQKTRLGWLAPRVHRCASLRPPLGLQSRTAKLAAHSVASRARPRTTTTAQLPPARDGTCPVPARGARGMVSERSAQSKPRSVGQSARGAGPSLYTLLYTYTSMARGAAPVNVARSLSASAPPRAHPRALTTRGCWRQADPGARLGGGGAMDATEGGDLRLLRLVQAKRQRQ